MAAENIAAVISSLTPEEQEPVKQFVEFRLHEKGTLRFKELAAWLRQHAVPADPLN